MSAITWTRTALPVAHGEGLGVAWPANGPRLAVLSPHQITLWDSEHGTLERSLKGVGAAPARGVAFSPDGLRIASVLDDGRVQIWECESGEPVGVVSDASFATTAVAWSPDRRSLALARNLNIELWESYSGSYFSRINAGHAVNVLAWSPSGDLLASAGDKAIKLWRSDLRPNRTLKPAMASGQEVSAAIAWSAEGDLFAAAEGGAIEVWRRGSFRLEHVLEGHSRPLTQLAVSADGRILASKALDRTIRFWDLKEWKEINQEMESAETCSFPTLAYHPALPILASADPEKSEVALRTFQIAESVGTAPTGVRIFVSYAHADRGFRAEFEKHLGPLKQGQLVFCWTDEKIRPGDEWDLEIRRNLMSADIVVLLVSPDFLDSRYCLEEVTVALERQRRKEVTLVPVLLRSCLYQKSLLKDLQFIPQEKENQRMKPVKEWEHQDEALAQVAQTISDLIEERARK
jgi:WD40 repeat protein